MLFLFLTGIYFIVHITINYSNNWHFPGKSITPAVSVLLIIVIFSYPQEGFSETDLQVKAVILGRIPSFVQWPSNLLEPENSEYFHICLIGKTAFGTMLDTVYKERTIKKKKAQIHYLENLDELTTCNLLYISESEKRNISQIVALAQQLSILTIGETEGFENKGVIIKYYFKNRKIKFVVNTKSAKESGLKISSQLLTMAKIINHVD